MSVRMISELPFRNQSPIPWVDVQPNFPWDDPEFSKRMLREHLDPSHDSASRRPEIMAAQVEWMDATWFTKRNVKKILDLACGPGLIANSFARKGYVAKGIDIAPAPINYARKIATDWGLTAAFAQGDLREIGFGAGYDAALFNYGVPNSFRWEEFSVIMLRLSDSLNPNGIAIFELIRPEAMKRKAGTQWVTRNSGGVFTKRPYIDMIEYSYREEDRTACEIHYVIDPETTRVSEYSICYQGYTDGDLKPLMMACGLKIIDEYDSLTGEKNMPNPEMQVIVAERIIG